MTWTLFLVTQLPTSLPVDARYHMRLNTSYRQIWKISAPIMLGSAAQNVVALTDSVFLYYLDETDFAAIGFVGVFYLIVAAIGFGFSRGGQIVIARRMGEGRPQGVKKAFYAMLCFELVLAVVMFLFMTYGCQYFFRLFVDDPEILTKSLEYLSTRRWGVFFSYTGVAMIALYTGIARTNFILVDTIILAAVNIFLDKAFIFGNYGFAPMGISGAGLASTLAEAIAFVIFVIYMLTDQKNRRFQLHILPAISWRAIRPQVRLSVPIVAQAMVGLGSWFIFFGIVENLGRRPLAITNLVRMVYLVLSIPTWGFSTGINTIVSHFIGSEKRRAVVPIVWKTAKLSLFVTMIITLPVVLFPQEVLYPLLGNERETLILDAQPTLYLLVGILSVFSFGAIIFNGLVGAGATAYGLKIQFWCAIAYLIYIYIVVNHTQLGLPWAWASEIFYWLLLTLLSLRYLFSKRWHGMEV